MVGTTGEGKDSRGGGGTPTASQNQSAPAPLAEGGAKDLLGTREIVACRATVEVGR